MGVPARHIETKDIVDLAMLNAHTVYVIDGGNHGQQPDHSVPG